MTFDRSLLQWIQDTLTCPALDLLMPRVTALGNGGAVWLLAAGGLLCTKKYRKQGVLLLGGLAAGALVGNVVLKNLVARPRPCWLDSSVQLLIPNPTDYSFPSGHTLSSVIGATVLAKTDRRFGYAAIPLAARISGSKGPMEVSSGRIFMPISTRIPSVRFCRNTAFMAAVLPTADKLPAPPAAGDDGSATSAAPAAAATADKSRR